MPGRPIRQHTRLAFALAAATWLACTGRPQSDAECSPGAGNVDADPNCIYAGAGKGPVIVEQACPDVAGPRPDDMDCPTFEDVFAILVDAKKGNCSADACHGNVSSPAVGILFPPDDADAFYQTLTTVTGSVGRPYVVPDDDATMVNESRASWIVCNLASRPGGGFPMPPPNGLYEDAGVGGGGGAGGGGGGPSASSSAASSGSGTGGGAAAAEALPPDIAVVRDWILCGAPPPMDPPPDNP